MEIRSDLPGNQPDDKIHPTTCNPDKEHPASSFVYPHTIRELCMEQSPSRFKTKGNGAQRTLKI